ncbi:MAG: metallophosphoesterase [Pseudomonadota bacterium]|nr:metallophosphoesterase [Pseudomonadota bacterium]
MRTLFVGDLHGCSTSLRALLVEAKPDRLILLGDLFAKGPDPRGVWDIIVEHQAEAVLGNHDARVLDVLNIPGDSAHHRAARALPEEALVWTANLPLFLEGPCWIGVHAGLHPDLGIAGTTRTMAITLRRWPDDLDHANPFWFNVWKGPERVFYGHDAVRGLQVHPRSVGLDSGCVYGNPLSGYLLEEERLIQVAGRG